MVVFVDITAVPCRQVNRGEGECVKFLSLENPNLWPQIVALLSEPDVFGTRTMSSEGHTVSGTQN